MKIVYPIKISTITILQTKESKTNKSLFNITQNKIYLNMNDNHYAKWSTLIFHFISLDVLQIN